MELKAFVDFDNTEIAFAIKSTEQLKKSRYLFSIVNTRWMAKFATGLVRFALAMKLPVDWIIKKTVFDHFCGGETINDSRRTIEEMYSKGVKTILDYSVEGEESEEGFDRAVEETLNTMKMAKVREELPFCVFKITGVASFELLEKVHAGKQLSESEQGAFERVKTRVDSLCKFGFENDVPILIDAEDSFIQDPVDDIAYEMMEKYNLGKAMVYNTYQMYMKGMVKKIERDFEKASGKNYYLGAKLVRGAYMEKERERAKEMGYEDPIHPNKEATDNEFNQGLKFCVENRNRIFLFCGSHNEYSNYYLTHLIGEHQLNKDDPRIYFSQLYGMGDHISFNLAQKGYNVAKYVPYGPVRKVMPYLFRRADENTSVEGQSSRELILIKQELKRRRNLKS